MDLTDIIIMLMKKKIDLKSLKVTSFVTSVEDIKSETVKGGNWNNGGLTRGNQICEETIVPDVFGICRPNFTIAIGCPDLF